jgi:hypothetical protein
MRVLVCGDRHWVDRAAIKRELRKFPANTVIIEGEAKGADSLARDVALELGFKVLSFPADWDKYHRAAGPIRNRQMLTEGKPDLVLAFHQDLTRSKGTKNMVTLARRALGDDKVLIFES